MDIFQGHMGHFNIIYLSRLLPNLFGSPTCTPGLMRLKYWKHSLVT